MKFRQVIKPNGEIVQEITDERPEQVSSSVVRADEEWESARADFERFLRSLALVATIVATIIMLFRS